MLPSVLKDGGRPRECPMNTIRIGVLGAARIAEQHVIPAVMRTPHARFVAFASRSGPARSRWREQYPEVRAFDDYSALIASEDVDAVYIPLPNTDHVPWAERALRAGKHVLVEKPAALTRIEAERLKTAVEQSGRVCLEAFMYRFHPQIRWLIERVRDGDIGSVRHVYAEFAFNLANDDDIRANPSLGGGSLWDVGCYPVHLTRALLGRPVAVSARRIDRATGVDNHMAMRLEYPEATASLRSGFDSCPVQGIRVIGTLGEVGLSHPFRPDLGKGRRWINQHEEPVEPFDLYQGEIHAWITAVTTGELPRELSMEDVCAQAELLEIIDNASRSGRTALIGES